MRTWLTAHQFLKNKIGGGLGGKMPNKQNNPNKLPCLYSFQLHTKAPQIEQIRTNRTNFHGLFFGARFVRGFVLTCSVDAEQITQNELTLYQ